MTSVEPKKRPSASVKRLFSINYYKCDQFDGLLKLISSLDWNKLNESKEYYTKIDKEEYHSSRENNIEDFTPNEIDVIQHLYNKEFNINKKQIYWTVPCVIACKIIKDDGVGYTLLNIGKSRDEWYYVSFVSVIDGIMYSNYYKCDQFDGLISLLKNVTECDSFTVNNWKELNESKEEYYTKIRERDYYKQKYNWIELSDNELLILNKYGIDPNSSSFIYRFTHDVEFVHSIGEAIISISRIDDEWFYVYFESKENNYVEYYRCDQFDGVIKLLSDKLVKEVREMKYLKLFEEFESSSYEVCSIHTQLDMDREDFNGDELLYLKKFISGLGLKYILEIKESKPILNPTTWRMQRRCNIITGEIFTTHHQFWPKGQYSIVIFKYVDEWYQVRIEMDDNTVHNTESYKCDQLNGIEELIKDKIK